MQRILIATLMFLFSSCSSNNYRSISEFTMKSQALKDGERIRLIVAVVGHTDNKEDKYYNQLIAVSEETGDTCNILIPFNQGLSPSDGDKTFNYFSPESQMAQIGLTAPENLEGITDTSSIKSAFPKYEKVIRDPKLDYITQNNYPTVMGIIGTSGNQ
jgi:hypothetical protein